jgi:Flp pilus assembly protein TadD
LRAELEDINQKVTEQIAKQMSSVASSLLKSKSPDTHSLCSCAWIICTLAGPEHQDPQLAVELTTKAVQLSPNDGISWNTLGVAEYHAKRWQRSVDAFNKAASLSGQEGPADLYYRAMAHSRLGQQDEARLWFHKAVEWKDRKEPHDEFIRRIHDEAADLLGIVESKPNAGIRP